MIRLTPARLLTGALSVLALLLTGAPAAAAPGDFDPDFGAGGQALFPLGAGTAPSSQINAIALDPQGRIVVGGSATDSQGNKEFLVARLAPDGSLDQSFGSGGRVEVQFGSGANPSSEVDALAIQPDGNIVAAGGASFEYLVTRLDTRGNFDSSFGVGGAVIHDSVTTSGGSSLGANTVRAVAVQADGQIVTAGDADIPECCGVAIVTRLKGANGAWDDSFGGTGSVDAWRPSGAGRHAAWAANSLALQPDGKIVVGGTGTSAYDGELMVARIKGNGDYDSSFGDDGMSFTQPFEGDEGVGSNGNAVAVQPDGKILVAGGAGGSNHPGWRAVVGRIKPSNGTLDSSFGGGTGLVFGPQGGGDSPVAQFNAMAVQPDGKVIVGGSITDQSGIDELLIDRLNPSTGSFDPTFGSGGNVIRQIGGGATDLHALALEPDARTVAAGVVGSTAFAVRLMGDPPQGASGNAGGVGTGGSPQLGPNSPPSSGTEASALADLTLSPTRFAAASAGASIARATGALVSYTDTSPSTTMLTVLKPARGVRRDRSCLKPRKGRSGRRCTRWVAVGRFTHGDTAGQNSFHFTGRVHRHKLRPGRYRLRARPRFGGSSSVAVDASFRIIR